MLTRCAAIEELGFESSGLTSIDKMISSNDEHFERNSVTKSLRINVNRRIFNQSDLNDELQYQNVSSSKSKPCKLTLAGIKLFLLRTFPIVTWLSNYKREYLMSDVISGATVCTMHIPGMGHAMLASLPPVVGVYMGFFPTLPYAVLTSSRHTSIGLTY